MTVARPILRGFHPDPSWCEVDGVVYLVTSTFNWVPGLPIYCSRDLASWEFLAHAAPSAADFRLDEAQDSGGLYAPTLRYVGGRFVIVCTSVLPDGSWDLDDDEACSGSFVITAESAEGPWSAPRWVQGAGGIDPDIYEDRDGTLWWTGTRLASDPLWEQQTEIWTRPFDLETARFVGPERVIWHGALEGAVWSEGPHIFWRDGWYYLLTAEGGTASNHAATVARARSIDGPWQGCPRNPVLTHRHLGREYPVQNVGHADLLRRGDEWWAAVLGVRSLEGHHLLGRETFLCPVTWEDGWPVCARGEGKLPCDHHEPEAPSWRRIGDIDADIISPAGPQWEGQSFSGVRVSSLRYGMDSDGDDVVGSLRIVSNARHWAGIGRGESGWTIETCRAGEIHRDTVKWAGGRPYLLLDGLTLRIGCGGEYIEMDARWLSTESVGGFTGCVMGLWNSPHPLADADVRIYC